MAQTIAEIPLIAAPQTLTIQLGLITYELALNFCNVDEGGWTLDIADASGDPIVCGIQLLPGADLLAQYAYLNFGGQLWVTTDGDPSTPPTYDNLGQTAHLLWVTP